MRRNPGPSCGVSVPTSGKYSQAEIHLIGDQILSSQLPAKWLVVGVVDVVDAFDVFDTRIDSTDRKSVV